MELNRRDIVIVNFYPKKSDEIGKIRPAIIVSDKIVLNALCKNFV